ncbi:MAG: ATP-grasp domain-containing protein [Gammaproteobacteria bacterium]|nr:ATP-grasp domain-containing protein [Gammaproteobacteria bacterium]MBT5863235.1 ATP-grasp domain-containing protein [Gammaproteobacteria bacterium]|tara:strand:- start:1145 stop:2056 length:912 start_codon:yes stop_codon:yes gene_type:complete
MRKVLILTDQKGWHYRQLKKSFENKNISVESANLDDLSITINNNKNQIVKNNGEILSDITDVFVRHIPGGSLEEVIINLNILKVFEYHGINIMNTSTNIETTVDKSLTSIKLREAGILTPDTWVVRGKDNCRKIVANLLLKHPLIYKPLFGSQGDNIVKIVEVSDFNNIRNDTNIYYIQEFLETKPSHDYRVLIAKNKNREMIYAMMRYSDSYINNISKGAKCIPLKTDKDIIKTGIQAASVINIPFCGVDIIRCDKKNYVIELNSIPAWKGMQSIVKNNLSDQITDIFIENMTDKSRLSIQK